MNLRTITGLVLIVVVIMLHELGHALAMFYAHVPIEEISFGFGPQLFSFTKVLHGDSIDFGIRAIPLGAFVSTELTGKEFMEQVPAFQQYFINGMGIWFNILTGYLTLLVVHIGKKEAKVLQFLKSTPMLGFLAFIVLGVVDFILQNGFFWKYLMLAFGIWMLVVIIRGLLSQKNRFFGPIEIFQELKKSTSIWSLLSTVGGISLGFALINVLPVFPLDGGHNVQVLLDGNITLMAWHIRLTIILIGITIMIHGVRMIVSLRREAKQAKARGDGITTQNIDKGSE